MTQQEIGAKRAERLNDLAACVGAERYLEVGVAQGLTFAEVDVPYKVAVDPVFRFDFEQQRSPTTFFHEMPSDEFFSGLASTHGTFDLIYLDGLHTFDQTFRDFCASQAVSHPRTVWLIDDTVPTSRLAANADQQRTRSLRRIMRSRDRRWMGDVYKVVLAIHDFFPQYTYGTFAGHGQTAVWREPRPSFKPTWNSLANIAGLSYGDFLKVKDSHMATAEAPEILGAVRTSLADR